MRVLTADQPEADLRMGFGGQHGFKPVAGIAAPDPVDLRRGAGPDHLKPRASGFPRRVRQANRAQETACVKAKPVPLCFQLGRQLRHIIIEAGHLDHAILVMQIGQHIAQRPDWVHRDAAIHARMQIDPWAGDRDFLAQKPAQLRHDGGGLRIEQPGVTDQRDICCQLLGILFQERDQGG